MNQPWPRRSGGLAGLAVMHGTGRGLHAGQRLAHGARVKTEASAGGRSISAAKSGQHRSSPPGKCDPRTHGGTCVVINPARPVPATARNATTRRAARAAGHAGAGHRPGPGSARLPGPVDNLRGHVGHAPARIARSLAQHVEGRHRVQAMGAHQVADGALDDHAVVQRVPQLARPGRCAPEPRARCPPPRRSGRRRRAARGRRSCPIRRARRGRRSGCRPGCRRAGSGCPPPPAPAADR